MRFARAVRALGCFGASLVSFACGAPGNDRPVAVPGPSASATSVPAAAPTAAIVAAPVHDGTRPTAVRARWSRHDAERARLVVGWIASRDMTDRGPSLAGVFSWFAHATVLDVDAFAEGTAFEVRLPDEPVHLVAVLDRSGRALSTLMGDAVAGNAMATVGPIAPGAATPIDLALVDAVPRPPRPEACAGDRFDLVRVDDPERGGPGARRLCVHLPKSYATQKRRRYPVVFLLPGFASTDTTYLRGDDQPGRFVDDVSEALGREAIVVGVDTSTSFGSTYFTDSPAQGAWETFATTTMVEAIDARFRTMPKPEARALAGHSTGGFNAVSLAMRHPETFGWVASSSPDALDMDGWLFESGKMSPTWLGFMRVEDATGGMGQMRSYAAAWSSLMWPADLASGAPREPARGQWRDASPMQLLKGEGLGRARKLSKRMFITCGSKDEAGLFAPAERFVKAASAVGVEVTWIPTELGHFDARRERWTPLLEGILRGMPKATP